MSNSEANHNGKKAALHSPSSDMLRYWIPVVVWGLVIWGFSTTIFSEHYTSRWIVPILHWVLPHAPSRTLFRIHHYIRKGAHVFEYCVFSLLLLYGIRRGRPGWRIGWSLAAIGLAVLWAGSDEIHQIFVLGRGPSLRDVFIDGSGAAFGQLLGALWLRKDSPDERSAQESEQS